MSPDPLAGGAILPGAGDTTVADTMTARAYQHPALDGRTVVRLTGVTLGPAEDLTMEFLGFTAGGVTEVGHAARRALGFPAWVLVHDPGNARHALGMVQEMERLARVARSKPGTAKDGYQALADRLGAAAPRLLPTFWEQAARAYLAADNLRAAGTCFTAARKAEQVHGLVVDEARVRDVHLEFAFAGALTVAMLSAYARDVIGRKGEAEAYELVKALSLRRVAGGLPPHATLATDLNRLVAAAGLDAEREADEVAALLLTYPATGRGPAAVWKSYRRSLVRMGKRDAGVRARLLEIFPEPPVHDADLGDLWLALLDETGATASLLDGSVPAVPWLERFRGSRLGGSHATLLALVERLAPRLIAEGGLTIAEQPSHAEVNLLDLCLSLGVPARIGPIRPGALLGLAHRSPGDRELTAIAADPVLRPLLKEGARRKFGRQRGGTSLSTPPLPDRILAETFRAAGVRDVLAELVDELAGASTVAALHDALVELCALWSPAGMAIAPDGFRRLLGVDLAAVLARSLRGGLLAELTWPAYEEATSRLTRPQHGISWPELVLFDKRAALVIAPDGRITEHVFPFPEHITRECTFVDGDLLVLRSSAADRGYWASRPAPADLFEADLRRTAGSPDPLPVPDGGLTLGTRPLRAGERRSLDRKSYQLATDGRAFWRCEPGGWREFDPLTGDAGRFSVPAFFAVDGLVADRCSMRPVPPEFAGSPMGVRDGLAGWRVTEASASLLAGEGLDGRRVTLPQRKRHRDSLSDEREVLIGAVLFPGAAEPLAVTRVWVYPQGDVRVWTAGGELLADEPYLSPTLPPIEWWHAMRPRDEAGSAALRTLDEATAAALLADPAAVAKLLPEVTDPILLDAITAVVTRAVELRRRIAEIAPNLETDDPAAPPVTDSALRLAWDGLCAGTTTYYRGRAGTDRILEQIRRAGAMLAAPETADPDRIAAVSAQWTSLIAGLGAVALRAASPLTGDDGRVALAALLHAVAGTPLDGTGRPARVFSLTQETMPIGETYVLREGTRVTLMFPPERDEHHTGWRRTGIQVSSDGEFGLPAGMTVRSAVSPSGRLGGERTRAFLRLLAERGPAPWRPSAAEALVAATGMGRAEAVLLLAGLPGIAMWEANFLTAAQRKVLGLTPAQAKVGRAGLQSLSLAERVRLLDAAMPVDPVRLWDEGPDVAAIAEVWVGLRGRRTPVPDDLVFDLGKVIDESRSADVLRAIAAPAADDWLSTDGSSEPVSPWTLRTTADDGVPFDGAFLQDAAAVLPWLAYHLSWDDPIRARLPEALRRVRERLRNPSLLVGRGMHAVGERPDAGPALVDGVAWSTAMVHHLAPARLTDSDDPAIGYVDEPTAAALRIVLSGWIEEVVATPGLANGDPHDPRASVPDLVDQVRKRHGLDAGAATYYLQLLALPDPGDKAVLRWNGWKATTLRDVQRTLTDAGLVVSAKRERAGRPVFLPGGWRPARSPRLPIETWKIPMYGDGPLPPMSIPRLFRTAWGRVTDGDVPRYHDLEETR